VSTFGTTSSPPTPFSLNLGSTINVSVTQNGGDSQSSIWNLNINGLSTPVSSIQESSDYTPTQEEAERSKK
jgi:hypothetical protein